MLLFISLIFCPSDEVIWRDLSFPGKGTRAFDEDEENYLQDLTDKMIASLDRRLAAPEAQSSEEVAQVLLNLAKMHLEVG